MYHSPLLRLPDAACLHYAASNSVEVWDIYSGLRLHIFRVDHPVETDMYVSAGVMHGREVKDVLLHSPYTACGKCVSDLPSI